MPLATPADGVVALRVTHGTTIDTRLTVIDRLPAQNVAHASVTVGGHGDQVDAQLLGSAADLLRGIAHPEQRVHIEAQALQFRTALREVRAVFANLLRLSQVQGLDVPGGPAVRHVD